MSGGTPTALSPAGSSKLGTNGSSKAAAGDVEMGEWHADCRKGLCLVWQKARQGVAGGGGGNMQHGHHWCVHCAV